MVAAGTGNDQIMAARNIRPLFDIDDADPEITVAAAADSALTRSAATDPETPEGSDQ
jgi:acetolactate synthase-1/2/3 large subunit